MILLILGYCGGGLLGGGESPLTANRGSLSQLDHYAAAFWGLIAPKCALLRRWVISPWVARRSRLALSPLLLPRQSLSDESGGAITSDVCICIQAS